MASNTQVGLELPAIGSFVETPSGNGAGPDCLPIRILHIVNDLAIGGTEMMLYKLLSRTNREKFTPAVISLDGVGKLGERIRQLSIPVYAMGMKPSALRPLSLMRLARTARRLKPDLIQGWMYHGNLAAQFARMFVPQPVSVFWNIRQSLYSLDHEKRTTARAIRLGARLSNRPAKILNNSSKSVAQHGTIGYETGSTVVIPNGFDTDLFTPSQEARYDIRAQLGVSHDTFLIGLIGRYHPLKDHSTFLRGGALLLKDYPDTQFVLAGKRVDWNNEALRTQVQELGMVERVHMLGERLDMPQLTAALDVATSSSYEEGFPNVIGEAMSCGIPCVVTDVSDLPWIVGDCGRVVPPRNPQALAKAWKDLIETGRQGRIALGAAARSRVTELFSLGAVAEQYEALYESAVAESEAETSSFFHGYKA
jgi:glycosyltransferase involved in cell wall biosynthesis